MKRIGQKGFSLVEVLVVIAIIGIVTAIAMPNLQRYATNSRLKSAAREVMGDIFLCKERAISENRQYRMTFNVGGSAYTIEQPPGTVIQTKDLTNFDRNIRIANAAFGGDASIDFQTRGTVDPNDNNGSAVLTNDRGSTATITLRSITGKTDVQFNMQ
jgi:prepilin-type N-terminal cleavage/methylation domain-containing protein